MIVEQREATVGATDLNSQILKLKKTGRRTRFVFEPTAGDQRVACRRSRRVDPTIYLNSRGGAGTYVRRRKKRPATDAAVNGSLTAA